MVSENVAPNTVVRDLNAAQLGEREHLAAAQFRLGELQRQRAMLAKAFAGVPAKAATFAGLKRDATLAADVTAALQQKSNEAILARYSAASDVAIVQSALAQSATVLPSLRTNFTAALIVGSVLAIVAVLGVDFFDDRVRDQRDLASAGCALPVLARIPGALGAPVAAGSDAYGELVAALRGKRASGTFAIVSPCAGDGKSTIALALARTLGEIEPGILLVDADLRNPSLHERVGQSRTPGLSDVLSGATVLDEVIMKAAPGVHIVTSGTPVRNALTFLQSPQFEDFLATARSVYRIVVVDAPALEPVIDGAVIAARCDATVLVLAANHTASGDLRMALERLAVVGTAHVAGVVFNGVEGKRVRPAMLGALTARLTSGVST